MFHSDFRYTGLIMEIGDHFHKKFGSVILLRKVQLICMDANMTKYVY